MQPLEPRELALRSVQGARALRLRRMPHLRWVYDDSLEHAQHLEDLIREARARDRAINPHVDEAADAAEVEADLVDDDFEGFDEVDDDDDDEDEDEEPDEATR